MSSWGKRELKSRGESVGNKGVEMDEKNGQGEGRRAHRGVENSNDCLRLFCSKSV